ncbi:MAG: hypothetical protein M3126_09855 [Candidatus Eremiobacteraeota bacterium]|nr:hypothetical protein [Candidatus Eremiobacteraeota bacterium]
MALALAIALHLIFSGISTGSRTDEPEKIQVAQLVRISVAHRPKPTPKPTPRPTPKPIIIIAPRKLVIVPRTPAPAAPAAKTGLAKSIAHTRHHSRHVSHIAVAPKPKNGAGLGASGTGRGKIGLTGNGTGSGGEGNGPGTGGNGTGVAGGAEPCGFVEFININGAGYDRSTGGFHQDILMRVHYGNKTSQDYRLDWQFYYPSEAAFPWSDQNIKNPDFPVMFQFPPADKRSGEPDIVQYVIQHSTTDGFTKLKDCPGGG